MNTRLKAILVAPLACFMLSGCEDITEYFVTGGNDPTDTSNCENIGAIGLSGATCVECNSGDNDEGSAESCGVEVTVRCDSRLANDVYGIGAAGFVPEDALGTGSPSFSFVTATAWYDVTGDGPSSDDRILCHEQNMGLTIGKHEWKCTNALTENGKNDTTFEVEFKYDESKNDC